MTVALSGHRVLAKNFDVSALGRALDELLRQGAECFLCGMALGFDLLCGELLAERKAAGAAFKLVACIPCADQAEKFSAAARLTKGKNRAKLFAVNKG